MTTTTRPAAPLSLTHALEAAQAFNALLRCQDTALWDTLARPDPRGLSHLLFLVVGEMQSAVDEAFELPALRPMT